MKYARVIFEVVLILIASGALWWSYSRKPEMVQIMSEPIFVSASQPTTVPVSQPVTQPSQPLATQPETKPAPATQPGWNYSNPEDW
jgi:hypothetical protein